MISAAARRLALVAMLASATACAQTAGPAAPAPRGAQGIVFDASGPDAQRFGGTGWGFATASRATWFQPAFSVDGFSRLDEIWPAATIARAAVASPWKRAPAEPALAYDAPRQTGGGRFPLDQYLARNPTTGLLIARGDTILVERYQYGRDDRHRLTSFSMAKTITAMLIGLAIADGAIASIEDTAELYVPALAGSAYGSTPIRHLLTMSSGVAFREDYDGNDDSARLARATLNRQGPGGAAAVLQFDRRDAEPGTRWYYASAETQVLGLVLRAAIKQPIATYLQSRVWQPMGAEADASWNVDRSGHEITYAFFNAVLRDYARFAMLLARGGRSGDRQLMPEAWIHEATRAHFTGAQTGRFYGYGFQTWVFPENDGSFALLGVRGQTIFVDPRRELIMVHTAVRPTARDPGGAETTALWRAVRAQLGR